MAKKLIDVQANGFKSYVDATAAAVGAEPALGNPGPGTWYLRAIDNVRSWVAQIPWAGIDKTGAVASDIGALPEIVVTGSVNFNSINSDLPCSAEISPSIVTNGPFGYAAPTKAHLLQSKGAANYLTQVLTTATAVAFRGMTSPGVWGSWRYVWDDANLPISALGLDLLNDLTAYSMRLTLGALASANPTATGTLTAPDVVVSNLAGTGTRSVATDSTGKLVLAGAGDTVTATASSGALTSLTDTNIVSASLSAGKWLVSVNFHLYAGGSGAGSVTIFNSGISTTSATRLADNFDTNENLQSPLTFGMSRPYMCHRVVTLASPGTVYGVALIVATGPVAFFANAGLIATKLSD